MQVWKQYFWRANHSSTNHSLSTQVLAPHLDSHQLKIVFSVTFNGPLPRLPVFIWYNYTYKADYLHSSPTSSKQAAVNNTDTCMGSTLIRPGWNSGEEGETLTRTREGTQTRTAAHCWMWRVKKHKQVRCTRTHAASKHIWPSKPHREQAKHKGGNTH